MASYGHSCSHPVLMATLAGNRHPSQHAPQGHTSMASYGRPSLPFASPKTLQTSPCSQQPPRATHQWLLMATLAAATYGHSCRLTWHASSCNQQPPRATHQWLLMATLAANRHPRATHQWLLMGVQVCRLPALKPSKRSKPLKPSKPLKTVKPLKRWLGMLHPAANSHPAPHINGFLWPLLQPTGTPGPHINGFLWASKSAVCQP